MKDEFRYLGEQKLLLSDPDYTSIINAIRHAYGPQPLNLYPPYLPFPFKEMAKENLVLYFRI